MPQINPLSPANSRPLHLTDERSILFYCSNSLISRLEHSSIDGYVRIIQHPHERHHDDDRSVTSHTSAVSLAELENEEGITPILIEGKFSIGDVVCEAAGVNMRQPISSHMWKLTLGLLKVAPKPIEIKVARERGLDDNIMEEVEEDALERENVTTAERDGHEEEEKKAEMEHEKGDVRRLSSENDAICNFIPPHDYYSSLQQMDGVSSRSDSINSKQVQDPNESIEIQINEEDKDDSSPFELPACCDGSYYQLEITCPANFQPDSISNAIQDLNTSIMSATLHHLPGSAPSSPFATSAQRTYRSEEESKEQSTNTTTSSPKHIIVRNPWIEPNRFGPERTIIFHTESLGIKLHRSPTEGIVHILHVAPYFQPKKRKPLFLSNGSDASQPIADHGGDDCDEDVKPPREGPDNGFLEPGDTIMEVGGVNIRRKIIGPNEWADMVHFIKYVGRPLDMVVAKDKLFTRERAGVVMEELAWKVLGMFSNGKEESREKLPEEKEETVEEVAAAAEEDDSGVEIDVAEDVDEEKGALMDLVATKQECAEVQSVEEIQRGNDIEDKTQQVTASKTNQDQSPNKCVNDSNAVKDEDTEEHSNEKQEYSIQTDAVLSTFREEHPVHETNSAQTDSLPEQGPIESDENDRHSASKGMAEEDVDHESDVLSIEPQKDPNVPMEDNDSSRQSNVEVSSDSDHATNNLHSVKQGSDVEDLREEGESLAGEVGDFNKNVSIDSVAAKIEDIKEKTSKSSAGSEENSAETGTPESPLLSVNERSGKQDPSPIPPRKPIDPTPRKSPTSFYPRTSPSVSAKCPTKGGLRVTIPPPEDGERRSVAQLRDLFSPMANPVATPSTSDLSPARRKPIRNLWSPIVVPKELVDSKSPVSSTIGDISSETTSSPPVVHMSANEKRLSNTNDSIGEESSSSAEDTQPVTENRVNQVETSHKNVHELVDTHEATDTPVEETSEATTEYINNTSETPSGDDHFDCIFTVQDETDNMNLEQAINQLTLQGTPLPSPEKPFDETEASSFHEAVINDLANEFGSSKSPMQFSESRDDKEHRKHRDANVVPSPNESSSVSSRDHQQSVSLHRNPVSIRAKPEKRNHLLSRWHEESPKPSPNRSKKIAPLVSKSFSPSQTPSSKFSTKNSTYSSLNCDPNPFNQNPFCFDGQDSPFFGNIKFASPKERAATSALFSQAFIVHRKDTEAMVPPAPQDKSSDFVRWTVTDSPLFVTKKSVPNQSNGNNSSSSSNVIESPSERVQPEGSLFPKITVNDPAFFTMDGLGLKEGISMESDASILDDPSPGLNETIVYADETDAQADCCAIDSICGDNSVFEGLVQQCGSISDQKQLKVKANKVPSPRRENILKRLRAKRTKNKFKVDYGNLDENEEEKKMMAGIRNARVQLAYQNIYGQSVEAASQYCVLDDEMEF